MLTSCKNLGNGTARWTALISMADENWAPAGPYIQAIGTTVSEPPVTLPHSKVRVQARMKTISSATSPCQMQPLIVLNG